jgi:hypothetical protein
MNEEKASQKNKAFYPGKRVFLTGHTGFKGAWMTTVLYELGTVAMGYALEPEKESLYKETDPLGGIDPYSSSKACRGSYQIPAYFFYPLFICRGKKSGTS